LRGAHNAGARRYFDADEHTPLCEIVPPVYDGDKIYVESYKPNIEVHTYGRRRAAAGKHPCVVPLCHRLRGDGV
jgi:hypothetical protein